MSVVREHRTILRPRSSSGTGGYLRTAIIVITLLASGCAASFGKVSVKRDDFRNETTIISGSVMLKDQEGSWQGPVNLLITCPAHRCSPETPITLALTVMSPGPERVSDMICLVGGERVSFEFDHYAIEPRSSRIGALTNSWWDHKAMLELTRDELARVTSAGARCQVKTTELDMSSKDMMKVMKEFLAAIPANT
jgi:hypothetical protein